MKSIKYQQFRSNSEQRSGRSYSIPNQTSLFYNCELPFLNDKYCMNIATSPQQAWNSPKKSKQEDKQINDNPYFKAKRDKQQQQQQQQCNTMKSNNSFETACTSPTSFISCDKISEIPQSPVRITYDNSQYNNTAFGYSQFHSSLRSKKRQPQKQNYLNDFLELKQIKLMDKLQKHTEDIMSRKQKGLFQITVFNYTSINKGSDLYQQIQQNSKNKFIK